MPREVVGIHLVCRQGFDVEDLENGYFKSGHWKILESRARTAKYIALHESRNRATPLPFLVPKIPITVILTNLLTCPLPQKASQSPGDA